jgi:hypothetical protein
MKITVRMALVAAVLIIYASVMYPIPASAVTYSNYDKALDLKILGLLANSPDNFDLGRAPSRVEGAVMLVRLLGKEDLAKQEALKHPFNDVPTWADSYIGYLYQNGLLKGISDSQFGSNDLMSAKQYLTLVLRSLGYVDKIDFDYEQAIKKASQTGLVNLTEASALGKSSSFLRNDMVGISYDALEAKLKSSGQTLLDKLAVTDKVVFKPAARVLGLYTSDLTADLAGITAYKPKVSKSGCVAENMDELFYLIRDAMYHNRESLKIDIQSYNGDIAKDFPGIFDKASKVVTEITGVEDFISSWKYLSSSNTFTLTIGYRYSKSSFTQRQQNAKAALNKARVTVAKLINPGMSEYDREKTLHDYIVNNTRYDYENYLKNTIPDESFNAYGCLVRGTAVCEGYSKAMKLLCDLSSLDCMVINGKAKNGTRLDGHAWNIVKVDGEYYHLDVTNDDPVAKNGSNILTYYYFNLPDSEMALLNSWDKSAYQKCTSIKDNYYYKNRLTADCRNSFDNAVQTALELRKSIIELKVSDYTEARYSNLSEIIFKTNAVLRYNTLVNEDLGIIRIYNIQYS